MCLGLPFSLWQMTQAWTCPHKLMLAEWTIEIPLSLSLSPQTGCTIAEFPGVEYSDKCAAVDVSKGKAARSIAFHGQVGSDISTSPVPSTGTGGWLLLC